MNLGIFQAFLSHIISIVFKVRLLRFVSLSGSTSGNVR